MISSDDYAEALQDLIHHIGLTEDQADAVWEWHQGTCNRLANTACQITVLNVMRRIFRKSKNTNPASSVLGILFALKLEHIAGVSSMEEAAACFDLTVPQLTEATLDAIRDHHAQK